MAKDIGGSGRNSSSIKPLKSDPRASTPVRNTPLPKPQPRNEITHDMIAERAYLIWQSGTVGSEFDHWVRAERELRGS